MGRTRKMNTMKTLRWLAVILATISIVMCAPQAHADDQDAPAPTANRPGADPFKALVEPPAPTAELRKDEPKVDPPKPADPVIPPVTFTVQAVASDRAQKVAVVEFEGQIYIVQAGTSVPDGGSPAFVVKSVTETQVSVFDPRIKRMVIKQIIDR